MSFIFHHRPIIMVNILGKNLYNVITRYMLAGSIVGPGAFSFVTEIVQVETLSQFGVIFFLVALDVEFSALKAC
ncbi:hypothetical protein KSS87_012390 [Heliosperma pusillum]|nr:hypothetical protein KSS87_012390 [Heliosperma pusillum]